MELFRTHVFPLVLIILLLAAGTCWSQQAPQATPVQSETSEIWQLVPQNSVVIVAYDGRPENATMQVLAKSTNTEQREKQRAALKKAVESFATLFGVSLDFVKDIDPWVGDQWAFVWMTSADGKGPGEPAFLVSSLNAPSADAALNKLVMPLERLGTVAQIAGPTGCPVKQFKATKGKMDLFASACGPVLAVAPSVNALNAALTGQGVVSGSAAQKAFTTLAGSSFYMYADAGIAKMMNLKNVQIPVDGAAVGISAIETGTRVRILGYPNEQVIPLVQQVLAAGPTDIGVVTAGIPAPSLVVATFPDLSGALGIVSVFGGKDPRLQLAGVLTGTRISSALTAVLPLPAGVVVVTAESEQAATEKAAKIAETLKQAKMPAGEPSDVLGVRANAIKLPYNMTLMWAQVGRYILLGSDKLALCQAIAAVGDKDPSITDVARYNETIAGLGNSTQTTVYVNLAPLQGIGYLIEGLGLPQWSQAYGVISGALENIQAGAFGMGFDGQAVEATFFLRAKPGAPSAILPATTAIAAAVAFPVFARARESATRANCMSELKDLSTAALMYADDHGGKLPSMTNWRNELKPYLRDPDFDFKCKDGQAVYAFNKNMGGLNINKVLNPSEVVLFFEAKPGTPNQSGSRADALLPHNGKGLFAFADAHVVAREDLPPQYHWVPKYQGSSKPAPKKPAPAKGKK